MKIQSFEDEDENENDDEHEHEHEKFGRVFLEAL